MSVLSIKEFADRLGEIMPVLMREFARKQVGELSKDEITLPQLLAIDFLQAHGECMMKDLALFLSVTTAAVTGLVDRLVRDGYCVRGVDPQDRRIVKVRLTAKGGQLLKRITLRRQETIVSIFGQIAESDRRDYLRILSSLKTVLLKDKK